MPNLEFVEGDMAEVRIDPGAFVASVHGESYDYYSHPYY